MNVVEIGYIAAGLLGLAFGSFAGASVWRLRARQLKEDKEAGEDYDKVELKRLAALNKQKIQNDRSQCLHCGHALAWYDLLPLVSWVSLKGKCRYCRKPIGWFEPLMELGTAALFVGFYHYWVSMFGLVYPFELLLWGAVLVGFVILFAYDFKWFLLPDVVMFPVIGLSALIALFSLARIENLDLLPERLLSIGLSVAILAGLYLVLWLYSKGKWIGFGDVKLGVALGLLLADWQLALLALFLANLIGTLIVLPGMLTKKVSRKSQIPFGPLLIAGFFIALFFGNWIIESYVRFTTMLMV